MKTIEERIGLCLHCLDDIDRCCHETCFFYKKYQGATEQKKIDDAEISRLKKAWEKEAEINHDAEMAYEQGLQDAIGWVCDWLRARNVMTDASIEGFRKVIEEK